MEDEINENENIIGSINEAAMAWMNARIAWIVREFGVRQIREQIVATPTRDFFPGDVSGSDEDIRELFHNIRDVMHLDRSNVAIELVSFDEILRDGRSSESFNLRDERFDVLVPKFPLEDFPILAATIAQHLGQVHLVGHERVTPNEPDFDPLVDLLTVFLGLGVIVSNSAIREEAYSDAILSSWKMQRLSVMSLDMFGYALAAFARIRAEDRPEWTMHLRADVRSAFRKSMKYFGANGTPDFVKGSFDLDGAIRQSFPTDNSEGERSESVETLERESQTRCVYCGETIDDRASDGICGECWTSIDENTFEMEEEAAFHNSREGNLRRIFFWVVGVMFGLFVLVSAIDCIRS